MTRDMVSVQLSKQYADAIAENVSQRTWCIYTPEMFGAVGDDVADDESAVRAAFTAANALARQGFTSSIWHPGATVRLAGRYYMPNLSTPIDVRCNVESAGQLRIATGYAGIVLRVGHATSGFLFQAAKIELPDVRAAYPFTAGSTGVQVINLMSSQVRLSRIMNFETGEWYTGLGSGTSYNEFFPGWISQCKVSIRLCPSSASGWVTQNVFKGGGVQQSGGNTRLSGYRHLVMDGVTPGGVVAWAIDGNTFLGTSWEGDDSEYCIYIRNAQENQFIGTRHEPGGSSVSITVSGDTLTTASAHPLAVGDMVVFTATSYPTGMLALAPYFVSDVPSSTTFKVVRNVGDTAIAWATAGTAVNYRRPHRIYIDNTDSSHVGGDNEFLNYMSWPRSLEFVRATTGNTVGSSTVPKIPGQWITDSSLDQDVPLIRLRNRSGTSRPLVAAYPTTTDPKLVPDGWTTALSDRGILFASSNVEKVRIFAGSGGGLSARKLAESVNYEIPTALRTQGGALTVAATCTASTTTTVSVTLTNVAVGDTVVASPTSDLPAGICQKFARVSAANTVKLGFENHTGSDVALSTTYSLCVIRQF